MSDVILKEDGTVTVVGNLGVGTDAPGSTLHVQGSHVLNTGNGAGYAFADRADGARLWVWYSMGGSARLWSDTTGDRMTVLPTGAVGLGTNEPKRPLHVEPGEIHSGGAGGGFSFSDRGQGGGAFVDTPKRGERWVWYAGGGAARLWSGGERLLVETDGSVKARSFEASGRDADDGSLGKGRTVFDQRGLRVQNKNPDMLSEGATVEVQEIEITPTKILVYDKKPYPKFSNPTGQGGAPGSATVSGNARPVAGVPATTTPISELGLPGVLDKAFLWGRPLDLVAEVRSLREEVTALRAELNKLQPAKAG